MTSSESVSEEKLSCPVTYGSVANLEKTTLADPTILAQPEGYYRAMRTLDPVHYDEKLGMYLVSRYDDLQRVLRDPDTFSLAKGMHEQYAHGFFAELKEILIRDGGGFFPEVIVTDAPYHTRIRRLMEKAFTAHRVKELEPTITALVGGMIDKLAGKGQIDGVKDFAVPMTISIICEQLGLRHYDANKIQRWSIALVAQVGRMQTREQMLENAKDICEMQNYLIDQIRERQAERRDDMISDLIYARLEDEDNPMLTFSEVVAMVRALLVAGNETTATALGNLLLVLTTQPDVAQQLYDAGDDDRLLSRFVEELLRIEAPVRGLPRMTNKEVELGGKLLPPNAHLLLLFASGNDDDKEFACPRTFDINRENIGRHLSFGAGIHRCIGLSLARMEIKVAAREIVRRLGNIKLAIPIEDIAYLPTIATRTIKSLPLTLTRRD